LGKDDAKILAFEQKQWSFGRLLAGRYTIEFFGRGRKWFWLGKGVRVVFGVPV
jgi:hypothetical protein